MTAMKPRTTITELRQQPRPRLMENYFYYIAVVLFVTATIKIISAFGSARILTTPDPVFGLTYRWLYACVALIELLVAFAGLFRVTTDATTLILFTWLGGCFLIYHGALYMMNAPEPCGCLGRATDWWPWLGRHYSSVTFSFAITMVVGSFLFLSNEKYKS